MLGGLVCATLSTVCWWQWAVCIPAGRRSHSETAVALWSRLWTHSTAGGCWSLLAACLHWTRRSQTPQRVRCCCCPCSRAAPPCHCCHCAKHFSRQLYYTSKTRNLTPRRKLKPGTNRHRDTAETDTDTQAGSAAGSTWSLGWQCWWACLPCQLQNLSF